MADRGEPGPAAGGSVGSVAEETARLLEALLGGAPPPPRHQAPAPSACPSCGAPEGGPTTSSSAPPPPPSPPPASTCHLCPVCQLLQVARSVRPDTVDRLAELAGALTEMLRDVASALRAEQPEPGSGSEAGAGTRSSGVEDIVVGTDDDPDDDPLDGPVDDDEPETRS